MACAVPGWIACVGRWRAGCADGWPFPLRPVRPGRLVDLADVSLRIWAICARTESRPLRSGVRQLRVGVVVARDRGTRLMPADDSLIRPRATSVDICSDSQSRWAGDGFASVRADATRVTRSPRDTVPRPLRMFSMWSEI